MGWVRCIWPRTPNSIAKSPSSFCRHISVRILIVGRDFKREAQAAAKLNHPNIVTIYEVSEFNGRPFFAMEHVEGQSLRELIKAKELPIERVIELAIQICEGLHKAHQSGIVHRDVKPANILIDADGRAKILDFGLAVSCRTAIT